MCEQKILRLEGDILTRFLAFSTKYNRFKNFSWNSLTRFVKGIFCHWFLQHQIFEWKFLDCWQRSRYHIFIDWKTGKIVNLLSQQNTYYFSIDYIVMSLSLIVKNTWTSVTKFFLNFDRNHGLFVINKFYPIGQC